jgi:hypothetical protein
MAGNGVKPPELDEFEKLRAEVQRLREDNIWYQRFVEKCTELIPEGYDDDVSPEAIIIRFLEDMDKFAGIIARLTSAYR